MNTDSKKTGMKYMEIYDNPEDLWEDNPGDYDDEDEAWDEWYDDGDEPYDE